VKFAKPGPWRCMQRSDPHSALCHAHHAPAAVVAAACVSPAFLQVDGGAYMSLAKFTGESSWNDMDSRWGFVVLLLRCVFKLKSNLSSQLSWLLLVQGPVAA
jgi:hypothetical protein